MAKKDMNKEKTKNNFFKELKAELKKVSWPTLKKLANNTSAVISIVIIVAAVVFILDVCFENLNKFGVGKLKALVSSDAENTETVDSTQEITDVENGVELLPESEETVDSTSNEEINTAEVENHLETEEVVE